MAPGKSAPLSRDTQVAAIANRLREVMSAPRNRRWNKMAQFALSLRAEQFPDALAAVERLPQPASTEFKHLLLSHWAELDPQATLLAAENLRPRWNREDIRTSALRMWASTDLDSARQWITTHCTGLEQQRLLGAVFSSAAQSDPDRVMKEMDRLPYWQQRRVRAQMLEQMAENDPLRAVDLALQPRAAGRSPWDLGSVLHVWLEQDSPAALAWLKSQPEELRNRQTVRRAIVNAARSAPEAARELISLLPPGQAREQAYEGAFWQMADSDPEALQRWLAAQPEGRESRSARLALARSLAAAEPARAIQLLEGLKGLSGGEHSAFNSVAQEYAQQDAQAAVAWAQKLSDPQSRKQALLGAVAGWAMKQPTEAAAFVSALPSGEGKSQAVGQVAQWWARADPEAALKWLGQVPNVTAQQEALKRVLDSEAIQFAGQAAEVIASLPASPAKLELFGKLAENWARFNSEGALAWARDLNDAKGREAALKALVGPWAETDAKGAAEYARELPDGNLRSRLLDASLQPWLASDPKEAADFVLGLPADAGRQRLLESMATRLASQDPQAAADFATRLPAGASQDALYRNIAQNWAGREPQEALKWAESLAAPGAKAAALESVLDAWATRSPHEAAQYVSQLGTSAGAEGAVRAVVSGLAAEDPAYAAQWVDQFPAGTMRDDAQ
jgi:hypothetical protein